MTTFINPFQVRHVDNFLISFLCYLQTVIVFPHFPKNSLLLLSSSKYIVPVVLRVR